LGRQNLGVDTGLVGRGRELALLRRRFADAVGGRGRVLLVAGEPGIGKSALVAVFAAEVAGRGVPVLVGRAVVDEGAPELWPWRRMFDAGGFAFPEVRTADPDPAAGRFQVIDRVVRSIGRAAQRDGMLVVLEDLHWADEASLSLLRHLSGEVGAARLLVVGTYRDPDGLEDVPPSLVRLCAVSTVETLRLGPLGVPDVAAYLAGLGETDPSWPPHIHERSGGNPLYVRELTRVLSQEGRLREPARELPLPSELRRLVGYRLGRLSAGCQALLGVCAAIGDDVDLGLLAELVPGPTEPLLAEAVGAGVLADDAAAPDRLRFSHAVVRQARYDELPRTERVALHRSIAEVLQRKGFGDEYAGDLARHRVRAAVDEPGRRLAAQACRAAAQAATRRGAVGEAHGWYERTLALAPGEDGAARAALLIEAAEAAYRAGLVEDAMARCTEAADLAEAAGHAALLAAAALVVRGIGGPQPNAEIVRLCERARSLLPDSDIGVHAQLLAQQAFATSEVDGIPPAVPLSLEALALAERCGDPIALIAALHARHQVLAPPDGVAERLALGTRLRALAARTDRPDGVLWSHMWRVEAHLQLGALPELETELTDLASLADRLGWPVARWYLLRACAAQTLLSGDFARATELMEQARDVALRSQLRIAMPLYWSQLQDVLRLTGRFDLDPQAPALAAQTPLPLAWGLFARYLWEAGDRDQAMVLYERARAVLRELREDSLRIPTVGVVGAVAAALGDVEAAAYCYDVLLPGEHYYSYSASGCWGATARLLGALAVTLGRTDDADRHFADAVAMETRIGAAPFLVLAQLDHAAALLARDRLGDRDRAARLVERAGLTAGRLGMAPAKARATELAAALGAASASGVQPLTAREYEIAGLVAQGLANRMIAERLVLSERTVETHVRNILTKLQLANRTQVAAYVAGLRTPATWQR
jgi:DNA-binding CsgD family transcriptional regulator